MDILLPLLLKYVLPLILKELVSSGVMTELEASAITNLKDFVVWVKSIKTYSNPEDFPAQRNTFGSN